MKHNQQINIFRVLEEALIQFNQTNLQKITEIVLMSLRKKQFQDQYNIRLKTQSNKKQFSKTLTNIKIPQFKQIKKYSSNTINRFSPIKQIKSLNRTSSAKQNLFKEAKKLSKQPKLRSISVKSLNEGIDQKPNQKMFVSKHNNKEGGCVNQKNVAEQIINRLRNKKSLKISIKKQIEQQKQKNQLIQQPQLKFEDVKIKQTQKNQHHDNIQIQQLRKVQILLQQKTNYLQKIQVQISKKSKMIQSLVQNFKLNVQTKEKELFQKETSILQKQKIIEQKLRQAFKKEPIQTQSKQQAKMQILQKGKTHQNFEKIDKQVNDSKQLINLAKNKQVIEQIKDKKIVSLTKNQLKQQKKRQLTQQNQGQCKIKLENKNISNNIKTQKSELSSNSIDQKKPNTQNQIDIGSAKLGKQKNNKQNYFQPDNLDLDQLQQVSLTQKKSNFNREVLKTPKLQPQRQDNIKNQHNVNDQNFRREQKKEQSFQKKDYSNKKIESHPPSKSISNNIQKATISNQSHDLNKSLPALNQPPLQSESKPQQEKKEKQQINQIIKAISRISDLIYFIGQIPHFCTVNMKKIKKYSFKNVVLYLYKYVFDKFRYIEFLSSQLYKKKAITLQQYQDRINQNKDIKQSYIKIKKFAYKKEPIPSKQAELYLNQQKDNLCFKDKEFFNKFLFKQINQVIQFYNKQTQGKWNEHQVNVCYFRMLIAVFMINQIQFDNVVLQVEENQEYPNYHYQEIENLSEQQVRQRLAQCYQIFLEMRQEQDEFN